MIALKGKTKLPLLDVFAISKNGTVWLGAASCKRSKWLGIQAQVPISFFRNEQGTRQCMWSTRLGQFDPQKSQSSERIIAGLWRFS
jgi:hypothetical protein